MLEPSQNFIQHPVPDRSQATVACAVFAIGSRTIFASNRKLVAMINLWRGFMTLARPVVEQRNDRHELHPTSSHSQTETLTEAGIRQHSKLDQSAT
jgi:hypothetical protein